MIFRSLTAALLSSCVFGGTISGQEKKGTTAGRLDNTFYAMDTCTKRPYPKNDITPAQQFDLLKELGYDGIAWTEESADQAKITVGEAEARGIKMFTIYCGATVTPEGLHTPSPLI